LVGLIELRDSADEQIVSVASEALWEISWGRPKDYDPKAEKDGRKPTFNPDLYTIEELEQLHAAIMLMARRQGLLAEEKAEDVAG
jgi:hypothetical protein